MGYTHYWYRELKINQTKMKAIAEDFAVMVLRLDDLGVHLAGGDGKGLPQVNASGICFNGPTNCGHPQNAAISIPWPSSSAHGVIDGKGQVSGVWFAGAVLDSRCCNGDCSYETFSFPLEESKDFLQPHERDKQLFFECTKTAYRPYDLAVTVALVIAKHHLEDKIRVSSDGELSNWIEGIELCRIYLNYEESYQFSNKGDLVPFTKVA